MLRLLVIFTIFLRISVSSSCYFPQQIHGNYITDRASVSISSYQVSSWGICHEHKNDNYLLFAKSPMQDKDCFKCYKFNVVTENIIIVTTEKGDKVRDRKCYANEDEAWQSCPTQNDIQNIRNNKRYHEMVLYKLISNNEIPKKRVPCPINGRYKINYTLSDSEQIKCVKSELDTCPSNSYMNLRFNECNLNYEHIQYECLDTWHGEDNLKFLALLEIGNGTQVGFKFRCAIYEEIDANGGIKITIGNGTSCSWAKNRKRIQDNSIDLDDMPKETIVMYPAEEHTAPSNLPTCSFPQNLLGKWTHFEISNQFMIYHDPVTQKTFKMRCVEKFHKSNRYLVHNEDQCLQSNYKCITMEQRTPNIVEFEISELSSNYYDSTVCEDASFDDNWSTIVRLDKYLLESACPISGNFLGILPDESSLCANLSSECVSKGIMHYNVFTCQYGEEYDDRKYLCIGQWEHEHLVYTFTKRIDMGRYECFVGTNISNNTMYIAESGESCVRGIDPRHEGMKMIKTDDCLEIKNITNSMNDTPRSSTDNYNAVKNSPTNVTNIEMPNRDTPTIVKSRSTKLFAYHCKLIYINLIFLYIYI